MIRACMIRALDRNARRARQRGEYARSASRWFRRDRARRAACASLRALGIPRMPRPKRPKKVNKENGQKGGEAKAAAASEQKGAWRARAREAGRARSARCFFFSVRSVLGRVACPTAIRTRIMTARIQICVTARASSPPLPSPRVSHQSFSRPSLRAAFSLPQRALGRRRRRGRRER